MHKIARRVSAAEKGWQALRVDELEEHGPEVARPAKHGDLLARALTIFSRAEDLLSRAEDLPRVRKIFSCVR